jgi:hypothetical protein
MAVIPETVQMAWAGSTGSIDRDGPVEYTAVWHLQVDTAFDQAQNIIIWWQLNKFGLAFPYAYANDTFGSLATCENISAVRKPETTDWWNVVVRYSRESDDARQTTDDKTTTSPLEYRPIIRASSNAVTKPGDQLHYLGGYSARISSKITTGVEVGDPTIPVSSNLKPFDPFPEVDTFRWWISVEQNLETFDGNKSYVGFTNGEEFSVDYKGLTIGPIVPAQAKIRDCEVEFTRENTVDFWKVRYYFEILPDGEDFLFRIPDIGMDSIACDGDPDLHGGAIGDAGQGGTPVISGRAPAVALIDPHGMPIRAPALLDGDGHALDVCGAFTPIYSTWWEGKEVTFQDVPVIKEILS